MKFNKQKVMKVLPFVILGYAFNKVFLTPKATPMSR